MPLPQPLIDQATANIQTILTQVFEHTDERRAVVIADSQSPLAKTLAIAYQRCLPKCIFIDFEAVTPADIFAVFATLVPLDLVILIQSTNFRLEAFRLRIELFNKSLKVIEHPHLGRMQGIECEYYIDSLAYDSRYYREVGHALKERIDNATSATVDSDGERLFFSAALEPAKLNIGDYAAMTNIGGQFPIGEVFTEAKDLTTVNGRVRIFVFGDTSFSVNKPAKPITLVIDQGRVSDVLDSTPEFDQVLQNIRADEGEVWLRELGFGLNRAFSKDRTVSDIGTYERMCGIHLSLGAKHNVFKKAIFKNSYCRHHVDVFAVTHLVYLDDEVVYQDGQWLEFK